MSAQVVTGIVLGFGDINVEVHRIQEGSVMHYLRISKVGELEGFALHATSKQLDVIYEGLHKWKEETSKPALSSTYQPQQNGEFTKT
jgi:hypothetical protein